jgi:hypothetical protein
MIKCLQVGLALLAPSVVLVTPVHAAGDRDNSPEVVFNSFAAAVKNDDVKAMMSHMTRDSQSATVGLVWGVASFDKAFFGFMNDQITPRQKKTYRAAIEEVMMRHGLPDDALTRLSEIIDNETAAYERVVAIGERVKDKTAFITEMMKVSNEVQKFSDEFYALRETKLKEVKIGGERAKAEATFPGADGKEAAATVYFKLESGVWKFDLIETKRSWPQPPPPPQVQPPATHVQPPTNYCEPRPTLVRRLFPCLHSR